MRYRVPNGRRAGFALMAALWLVVLVGVTGYELSVRSRSRRLAVANSLEMIQASSAAEAGLETVRSALERQLAHPLLNTTRRLADATIDPWGDLASVPLDTLQLGDERTSVRIYDAGARLQINRASEDEVRRFLTALSFDANVADRLAQRILDWRDPDDLRRARGAEREDYLRAGAQRLPSNADFARVDELRSVDGVTPEIYARIIPYLSVRGSGQINANTAPRAVLLSLAGVNEEAIGALTVARQAGRPVRSLEELSRRVSSGTRAAMGVAGNELSTRLVFDTREIVVHTTGWLAASPVRSEGSALYQRNGDALVTAWRQVAR